MLNDRQESAIYDARTLAHAIVAFEATLDNGTAQELADSDSFEAVNYAGLIQPLKWVNIDVADAHSMEVPTQPQISRMRELLGDEAPSLDILFRASKKIAVWAMKCGWKKMVELMPHGNEGETYEFFHARRDEAGLEAGSNELLQLLSVNLNDYRHIDQHHAIQSIGAYINPEALSWGMAEVTRNSVRAVQGYNADGVNLDKTFKAVAAQKINDHAENLSAVLQGIIIQSQLSQEQVRQTFIFYLPHQGGMNIPLL